MKLIIKNKQSTLFLIPLILFSLLNVVNAIGHSPSAMTIEYNINTSELSATINHSVSSSSHYIELVEIRKNSELNQTHSYTSQSQNIFTYIYSINCSVGDILSVKAYCNEGGSITKTLTVNENTFTNTTNTASIAYISLTLVSLLGFTLIRRKK